MRRWQAEKFLTFPLPTPEVRILLESIHLVHKCALLRSGVNQPILCGMHQMASLHLPLTMARIR